MDEVLALVAESSAHEVLIAVDLKAEGVERDVVQLAAKHQVLDRLLFIGRTISEPEVRRKTREVSAEAQVAAVANDADELPAALDDRQADWVYLRFLPTSEHIEAVRSAGKRAFIAGPTVSGELTNNWRQAANAGVDAILTDYPLELRSTLRATGK